MNFEKPIIKEGDKIEKGNENNPYSSSEYYEICRKQIEKTGVVQFRGHIDFTDKYQSEISEHEKYSNTKKIPGYIKRAKSKVGKGDNVIYYDVVRKSGKEISDSAIKDGFKRINVAFSSGEKHPYFSIYLSEFDKDKEEKDSLYENLKFKLNIDLSDKVKVEIVKMAYDKLRLAFKGLVSKEITIEELVKDIEKSAKEVIRKNDEYYGKDDSSKFNLEQFIS